MGKKPANSIAPSSIAPVPLVIGITGHIDLRPADEEKLQHQVGAVFKDICRRPGEEAGAAVESACLPLVLLSSLAEGADRLAAQVALDSGAQLIAVLPMPREEYIKSFPNSVAEFDRLLNRAAQTIIIPWASLDGELKEDDRQALQYLLAGVYVARHSRYLIALWDGVDTHKLGGTSDVVAYRGTGRLNLDERLTAFVTQMRLPYGLHRRPLDPPETGPLYHIPTPRRGSDRLKQVGEFSRLAPKGYDPQRSETYFKRLGEINDHIAVFNKDVLKLLPNCQADVEQSRRYMFPDDEAARLPPSLKFLRQTYAMADTLAIHFQRLTYRSLSTILKVIFVVVVVFSFYAHLLRQPHHVWALTFYLVLLAAADLYYRMARRRDYQNKFQDYRALAEGLRVQFFWKLAGLYDSVSDHYFRKQKSELAWIPNAIQACSLLAEPVTPCDQAAVKYWIDDQHNYFHRRSKADLLEAIRYKERGNGLLLVSLMLALYETIHHPPHWLILVPLAVVAVVGFGHLRNKWKEIDEKAEQAGDFGFPAEPGEVSRHVFRHSWLNFFIGILMGVGIVGALGGAWLLVEHSEILKSLFKDEWHDWAVVAMGLTALAAALSHDYVAKRALTEHHKQYGRTAELYKRAKEQFNEATQHNQPDDLAALVHELGREALAEHGDWVLLHRERPLELPKAEI